MGYLSQSRRSSLPLKFFEKNRIFFFTYIFELNRMDVENERMWKMSKVFVPQVGVAVYLRNFSKNLKKIFLLISSNWTVWKWKMKECEKYPGYLCVAVYLWNFSKKIENLFLLIFSNWITWNWNMIKCGKFQGRLYPKWSGQFTFEYFRKKSKFLFYSFFRITSFTTEWWENVKHACLK